MNTAETNIYKVVMTTDNMGVAALYRFHNPTDDRPDGSVSVEVMNIHGQFIPNHTLSIVDANEAIDEDLDCTGQTFVTLKRG